jgi:hypothetical protein
MNISRELHLFRWFKRKWLPLLALALALLVFLSEPFLANHFVRGHFNWVSMHSLAIAKHSYLSLGGVGYSCEFVDAEGGSRFDYFNRYPIPFALLSRWVLNPWVTDPAAWLYAARQWMNLIFLATCGALFVLLRSVGASRGVAAAAVLGSVGAEVVLQYKSMFHFDQPSLLFYVVLIFVSVRVFVDRSLPAIAYYFISAIGIASGRSAILLLYLISVLIVVSLRCYCFMPRHCFSPSGLFARFPALIALRGLVISGSILSALTFFNVLVEARVNRTGWGEVSIVRSAMRRLGLSSEGFEPRHVKALSWGGRAVLKLTSNAEAFVSPVLIVAFSLSVILVIFLVVVRRGSDLGDLRRRVGLGEGFYFAFAATSIASLSWIFLLKNLFVFHVYAGMILLPFLCLILFFVLKLLLAGVGMFSGAAEGLLAPIALASILSFFVYQLVEKRPDWLRSSSQEVKVMQSFFSRLKGFNQTVSRQSLVLYNPEWMPRSPYAQCALLDRPLLRGDSVSASVEQALAPPPRFSPRLP